MGTMGHHGIMLNSSQAAPTDPDWANVVSLLHFDGADGSTTFTDQTGRVWTRSGSAQIDTAQSKFGGASYLPNAASSGISAPFTGAIDGTEDFTIEFWIRFAQVAEGNTVLDIRSSGSRGLVITQPGADPASLNAYATGADNVVAISLNTGASSVAAGVWYHLAYTREGDTFRLFLDGDLKASDDSSVDIDFATSISFGNNRSMSSTVWFEGHLDDLRITAGVARYTANFTPPAAAFPNS